MESTAKHGILYPSAVDLVSGAAVQFKRMAESIDRNIDDLPDEITQLAQQAQDLAQQSAAEAQTYAANTQELQDQAVAGLIADVGSRTSRALNEDRKRRFVIFGDSWTTPLAGQINLAERAVQILGGQLIKNYGVAGAILGPQSWADNTVADQAAAASSDDSYSRIEVTDVLLIAGLNNIGNDSWILDADTGKTLFDSMKLYPYARYWYVANGKYWPGSERKCWEFYDSYSMAARLSGWAVSEYSPIWDYAPDHDSWWPADADYETRHMGTVGQERFAHQIAGFLNGGDPMPSFAPEIELEDMTSIGIDNDAEKTKITAHVDGYQVSIHMVSSIYDPSSPAQDSTYYPIASIPVWLLPSTVIDPGYLVEVIHIASDKQTRWVAMTGNGKIVVDGKTIKNNGGYFVIDINWNMKV